MEELAQSIKEQGLIVPIKVRPVDDFPCECIWHDYRLLTNDPSPANEHSKHGDEHIYECRICKGIADWIMGPDEIVEDEYTVSSFEKLMEWFEGVGTFPVQRQPFEIVYGHRRVEACRRGGLREIEAIVEGVDDTGTLIQALIENVQREDMEQMDLAHALRDLQSLTGWTQSEMGRQGILPQKTISVTLALLNEPENVQRLVKRGSGGGHTVEIGTVTREHVTTVREAGLMDDLREQALLKAAREGLSRQQTRKVAESVAATKDPTRREMLLETPYSTFIHDPEMNRARAREHGVYDPMSVSREPSPGQQWEATPEVKAIIDTLRTWEKRVSEMKEAAQQGKFAPEAKAFVLLRVEKLVAELQSLASALKE